MQKILLIGGAGYVGCVLTQELLDRGYDVRILDRLYFGSEGLKDCLDRVELVRGDMRKTAEGLFNGISTVINIGGLSNDPTAEYNPQANYEMNTVASIKLADLCVANGVQRYIFASSCSIYDRGVSNEERDLILNEEHEVDPKAAYSGSKRAAEIGLLKLASDSFCPIILRKGTVYGFSPRMRYDLVVNTFVKDALLHGSISLHFGGEMWRPLVDIHDVAQAYIAAIEAEPEKVRGQIFNIIHRNYRISELALRVRETLREAGVNCDLRLDYGYKGVRSYRVSGRKIDQIVGFRPEIDVESSVIDMVEKIRTYGFLDFDNPKYYNIRWMRLLEQAKETIDVTGSIFGVEREPRGSSSHKKAKKI